MSTETKASNALVATVDFYSRALAEKDARIAQQAAVIERLTEQLKVTEARARDEEMAARTAESQANASQVKSKRERTR